MPLVSCVLWTTQEPSDVQKHAVSIIRYDNQSMNFVIMTTLVSLGLEPKWVSVHTTSKELDYPVSKVHGANMGPTWVRQDPGGPHVGPMNLAI